MDLVQKKETRCDVGTPGPGWLEDEADHALARALREGRDAMVRAARAYKYMKPNPGELERVLVSGGRTVDEATGEQVSQSASGDDYTLYDLRLERSDLPNAWRDSILDLVALPFAERIQLRGWDVELQGEDLFDEEGNLIGRAEGWVDDLDREGRSIDEWAADAFEQSMFDGIAFGLVDNDPRKFASAAERIRANGRPYCSLFTRSQVPRITLLQEDGLPPRLLQVVLVQPIRNTNITDPNSWVDEEVEARKVLTAGFDLPYDGASIDSFLTGGDASIPLRVVTSRIYIKSKAGGWEEDLKRRGIIRPDGNQELLEIPLAPLYSKRVAPYRGRCAFLDTAWIQNTIWNMNSELLGLAREAALTRVHISGYDNQQPSAPHNQTTRNSRFTWSEEPGSRLQVGEFEGSAAKMLMEMIKWKSEIIRIAHHRLASEKPRQPVTAREITVDAVQAASALEMWIGFQERGWKRMLDWMALLGDLTKRGTAQIPHDFGLPSAGVDRNQQNLMSGNMFAENYWNEAARAGDINETTFDVGAEVRLQAMKLAAELGVGERVAAGEVHILESIVAMIKGDPVKPSPLIPDFLSSLDPEDDAPDDEEDEDSSND